MIKIIKSSELDNRKLSKIKIKFNDELNDFDFSKVVVKKPWGYEYLVYEGDSSAVWCLKINKGSSTSMHCHIDKITSLVVLSGEVMCSTLNNKFSVKEGGGITLHKKTFHSTEAISEGGALVMEIESSLKKADLVRLSDQYGREVKGYESKKEMSLDLEKYEAVSFEDNSDETVKKIGNTNVCIAEVDNDSIKNYLERYRGSIILILEGSLVNKKNGRIFNIGEMFRINDSREFDFIKPIGATKILLLIKEGQED